MTSETIQIPDIKALNERGFAHRTPPFQRALRRFAMSITILTVVGHAYLGFEQSMMQPVVALATAYSIQLFLEWVYALCHGTRPRFLGSWQRFVDFLLPAHIVALSIAMLLYFNDRLWPIAFATAVAIGSKSIFRVPSVGGSRHFFNPSNLGISVTLFLMPTVGLTMPWQWTTELSGIADWLFPVLIFALGTLLHLKHAERIWVILAFLVTFIIQAILRSLSPDVSLIAALAPTTGVAAAIFTFYMAPDPATSPSSKWSQIAYGSAISFVYMGLMLLHVVYALFYALTIVCLIRGLWMAVVYYATERRKPNADQIAVNA